jgi:hypothetical protein
LKNTGKCCRRKDYLEVKRKAEKRGWGGVDEKVIREVTKAYWLILVKYPRRERMQVSILPMFFGCAESCTKLLLPTSDA